MPQMSRIIDADQIALLFSDYILRKEVIQPQVPLRLPCYDFIPITKLTFDHVIAGFGCSRLS